MEFGFYYVLYFPSYGIKELHKQVDVTFTSLKVTGNSAFNRPHDVLLAFLCNCGSTLYHFENVTIIIIIKRQ